METLDPDPGLTHGHVSLVYQIPSGSTYDARQDAKRLAEDRVGDLTNRTVTAEPIRGGQDDFSVYEVTVIGTIDES
jgi:hypothetical protein